MFPGTTCLPSTCTILPECCRRAPQPVPGPAEITVLGSLGLCWLLDPTALISFLLFINSCMFLWAGQMFFASACGGSLECPWLGRTPARFSSHPSDPHLVETTHPSLKSGFSDLVAGLSGFLPPSFFCFSFFFNPNNGQNL